MGHKETKIVLVAGGRASGGNSKSETCERDLAQLEEGGDDIGGCTFQSDKQQRSRNTARDTIEKGTVRKGRK